MKLLTKEIKAKLAKNQFLPETERKPWLKLFGGSSCTWLISEMRETELGDVIFFGLCDLGHGFPEIGSVTLSQLEEVRFPPFGLPVERDMHFEPAKTLIEYAEDARQRGRVVA